MDRAQLLALCELLDLEAPGADEGDPRAYALVARARIIESALSWLVDREGRWIERWEGISPVGDPLSVVLSSGVDRASLTALVRSLQAEAVRSTLQALDDGRPWVRGAEGLTWGLTAPCAEGGTRVEALADAFGQALSLEDAAAVGFEVRMVSAELAVLASAWKEGDPEPDAIGWREGLSLALREARARGARSALVRVVTQHEDDPTGRVERLAASQEGALRALGFAPAEARVEYVLPLARAIEALSPLAPVERLAWRQVAGDDLAGLTEAAAVLRASAEGDPDYDPDEDALSFLLARTRDESAAQSPECVQLGALDGEVAAIVLPTARPARGVGGLFYLGVLPSHRGRGLGVEAMLHGLRALSNLGARTLHDGTSMNNAPARALFRRVAPRPTRSLSQWKRSLGKTDPPVL